MKLLFVAQSPTPYWLHFIRRANRELAPMQVQTVFTHSESNAPWALNLDPELNASILARGGHSRNPLRDIPRDLTTYRKLLDEVHGKSPGSRRATALLVGGYNDVARLRLLEHARREHIPVLLFADSNVRGDSARGLRLTLKRGLLRYITDRVAAFMVCGRLGRDYFLRYGVPAGRIYNCPYEPDYQLIESITREQAAAVAAQFGLPSGRRRIIYSGRLVPQKRVDLLLRAFADLAGRRPGWDLIMVGDGPLRKELEALVPQSLRDRVAWLGFQGRQEVVSCLYRNADLLCLPSSYEPWALVINEAACAGLAIVASDVVGAAAEIVRDGESGKLFRAEDLGALTEALWFCTDPDRIDALRRASPEALADWRRRGDPIQGIRKALSDLHLLPKGSSLDAGA